MLLTDHHLRHHYHNHDSVIHWTDSIPIMLSRSIIRAVRPLAPSSLASCMQFIPLHPQPHTHSLIQTPTYSLIASHGL
jgi:hypothetical protein